MKSKNKILLVEDDQELSLPLMTLLENKGFDVDQCFDGESGFVQATSNQYQPILA